MSVGFEVKLSDRYEEAIEKVGSALQSEGFGILTRIDVRETLREKIGADFRPYVILGACNPPLAQRALEANPEAGLMLPCNVTVEQDEGGGSVVRIIDPDLMLGAGGMDQDPAMREVAAEARDRLARVAEALRG